MKNGNDYSKHKRILAYIKFAILLFVLIGVPVILYLKFGADVFSKDAADTLIAYLRANRRFAFILIILIQMIQVIICILPGQPIQFASSYMFGVIPALFLSLIGAIIGATITFYLSKLLGRDMVNLIFDKDKIDDYHRKLNSGKGLALAGLIYLIPGVPKDLVSYVAGISEMKFRPFILVSSIARIPGMLGSLLLGSFVESGNYVAIGILVLVMVIFFVIFYIKRKAIFKYMDSLEEIDETK